MKGFTGFILTEFPAILTDTPSSKMCAIVSTSRRRRDVFNDGNIFR